MGADERPDKRQYEQWLTEQQHAWESLCTRCGACCGIVEGDPCEHLREDGNGRYRCAIYQDRFGLHKTVSGRPFRCVPIRDILHKAWPGDHCCGYKIRKAR